MFYNRGMSQVGFPFERNNGNGDDDDNNGDSALLEFPFFLTSNLAALHHIGITMNSEEKP